MKYRSPENQRRAARGLDLIESHPDFGRITDDRLDDLFIAATDSIADILHALNMAGVYATTDALGPEDVLNRALWSYQGECMVEIWSNDERPPGPWDDFPARKREEPRVFGQGPA